MKGRNLMSKDDTPWSGQGIYKKTTRREVKVTAKEIPKFKNAREFTKFLRNKLQQQKDNKI